MFLLFHSNLIFITTRSHRSESHPSERSKKGKDSHPSESEQQCCHIGNSDSFSVNHFRKSKGREFSLEICIFVHG
jgi:hypothetical protein